VIEAAELAVDESTLTGESVPVAKDNRVLLADTPLPERVNMVFAGTIVTRGQGRATVTSTGMNTELGHITGLVLESKEPKTPLQLAMKQLSGLLVWVALFFSILIPVVGLIQGKDSRQMILTGLSLAFATIPEELPIIVTMVLGVGAFSLAKKNVLVKRLRAAETLGSVSVIVTDKTGTITENKMALARLAGAGSALPFPPPGGPSPVVRRMLEVAALSTDVKPGKDRYAGDPTEVALFEGAARAGLKQDEIRQDLQRVGEFTFDDIRKMTSTVYRRGAETMVFAHGAPEVILMASNRIQDENGERPKKVSDEASVQQQIDDMAKNALRVIGLAYKRLPDHPELNQSEAEKDLVFAGLAGLEDPPRAGVKEALRTTGEAGIRTIVVSGDHPLTVQKIAREVGLSGDRVMTGAELDRLDTGSLPKVLQEVSLFARTSPEDKLKIVQALQQYGEVVAVTGDGVNDAPALKTADIGVAMGETGTEVAREVAGMVLTDDSFISVAAAVREGRKIFDNLKKGVTYYLCVKVALVLVFLIPLILGISFPFAPIQIILLELFMDLAASATFVAEPIEPGAMSRQHHRRNERFVDGAMLSQIATGSLSLAAAVMINYLLRWYGGASPVEAQTVAFATWIVGHIFLAMAMRSQRAPLWRVGFFSNPVMLLWALLVVVFILVVTLIPPLQGAVKTAPLSARDWLMVIGVPLITIFWMEIKKAFTTGRQK
jgi:Ca2+-transporting ATPase